MSSRLSDGVQNWSGTGGLVPHGGIILLGETEHRIRIMEEGGMVDSCYLSRDDAFFDSSEFVYSNSVLVSR